MHRLKASCALPSGTSLLTPAPPPTPWPPSHRRAPFIKPTHIALAMFRQPQADAPLLHFSASQLSAVMNAPNFTGALQPRAGRAWGSKAGRRGGEVGELGSGNRGVSPCTAPDAPGWKAACGPEGPALHSTLPASVLTGQRRLPPHPPTHHPPTNPPAYSPDGLHRWQPGRVPAPGATRGPHPGGQRCTRAAAAFGPATGARVPGREKVHRRSPRKALCWKRAGRSPCHNLPTFSTLREPAPPAVTLPASRPCRVCQVRFNPNMRFGPQPGQTPHFRLTVATPRLSVRPGSTAAPAWHAWHPCLLCIRRCIDWLPLALLGRMPWWEPFAWAVCLWPTRSAHGLPAGPPARWCLRATRVSGPTRRPPGCTRAHRTRPSCAPSCASR